MKEMTIRPESNSVSNERRSRQALTGIGQHAPEPVRLSEVTADEEPRISTTDFELDRVLGGGIVPGSMTLIGGEPGIGKSTLAANYFAHEESPHTLHKW